MNGKTGFFHFISAKLTQLRDFINLCIFPSILIMENSTWLCGENKNKKKFNSQPITKFLHILHIVAGPDLRFSGGRRAGAYFHKKLKILPNFFSKVDQIGDFPSSPKAVKKNFFWPKFLRRMRIFSHFLENLNQKIAFFLARSTLKICIYWRLKKSFRVRHLKQVSQISTGGPFGSARGRILERGRPQSRLFAPPPPPSP